MSSFQQFSDEIQELTTQVKASNPDDIVQFCANYFNKRLEDQRAFIWSRQKDLNLSLDTSSSGLFPQVKKRESSVVGIPTFKSPFKDNDPHTIDHHHSDDPASQDKSINTANTNSESTNNQFIPDNTNNNNTTSTNDNNGLFKSSFGVNTKSPFNSSSSLDPNDPAARGPINTNQTNNLFSSNYTPGSGFATHLAKASPLHFNANRRVSVSAEALNPDNFSDDWKPPVHDFSEEQLKRLNASVAKNFLFSQLDEESLKTIIFALEEKRVAKGLEIIKQGDEGDFFYVVESGQVDFYVNGNKVNSSGPGSSFGELALMYNSPRAATAIAETDCILWALDRMTFRRILLEGTSKKRAVYENFLKEVPVLKSLSSYERSKLADALNTETYKIGENVVTEGDKGENFYFIEDGSAEVIKEDEGVISTLKKGDYFGELALLHDSPRLATVKAITPLKVVTLGKSGFQRLLGPAVEVLKLQDPTKHD